MKGQVRTIATVLAAMLGVVLALPATAAGDTQDTRVAGESSNADDARRASALNFDSACKADPPWARQLLARRGILRHIPIEGEHGTAWKALIAGMARLATLQVHEGPATGSPRYDQDILTKTGTADDCGNILEKPRTLKLAQLNLANLDVPMRRWLRCATKECLLYGDRGQNDACCNLAALLMPTIGYGYAAIEPISNTINNASHLDGSQALPATSRRRNL